MTEPGTILCATCPVLRPKGTPRLPRTPQCCDGCRDRLSTDLTALPDLYGALEEFLEPGTVAGERRAGGFESRLPAQGTVLNLISPGSMVLSAVGQKWIADQIGDSPPLDALAWIVTDLIEVRQMRETMPTQEVKDLTQWLANRLDWICAHYLAVDEFASDLRAIVWSVRNAVGMKPLVHRLTAPCPTCAVFELEREDGADYVECRNCHRLWTEDEYRRLCVVLAAEAEARGAA